MRRRTSKPVDFRQLTLLLTPSELEMCDILAKGLECHRQDVLLMGLRMVAATAALNPSGGVRVTVCPLHGAQD